MIPTESEIANQSLLAWDNWLNTAPGLYVLNWEQAQFNRAVDYAVLGAVVMLSAIKRTPRMKLVGKISSRRPSLSQTLAPVTQSKTTQQTNSTND